MDKPIYASHKIARNLWHKFNKVVTLQTIFRQEGDDLIQKQFHHTIQNMHNTKSIKNDWELLISHK